MVEIDVDGKSYIGWMEWEGISRDDGIEFASGLCNVVKLWG